jgi:hypothetical protein
MIQNEEVVDRINGQYHWAEQNNEESANDKQHKRAEAAKRKKERKIQERQERHQKLVEKVRVRLVSSNVSMFFISNVFISNVYLQVQLVVVG